MSPRLPAFVRLPSLALALALALGSLPGSTGCDRGHADPGVPQVATLDATQGALRARFERDAALPRVLAVASPT